ncbi:MAG: glycosyltransferase family 2 protein [Candidatus Saganbacteria bacterium]|nr:glycosyltransferase family 2 protein [Candidatus Saganbacteria bacterium]
MISIIIPTLNEDKTIPKCLDQFKDQEPPFEIIVIDAKKYSKGRAKQMNIGAKQAKGDIFLFLHADTFLPKNGLKLIRKAMSKPNAVGGFFGLKHDETTFWYDKFSFIINFRSTFTTLPYGDQAIFCSKEAFDKIVGYTEIPIMEDYDFSKRLSRIGRLIRIKDKVSTSFRRFEKGILRYMLKCNIITILYHMGVPPEKLKKFYDTN